MQASWYYARSQWDEPQIKLHEQEQPRCEKASVLLHVADARSHLDEPQLQMQEQLQARS